MKNVLNKIAGVTVVLLTCVFSMGTTWQIGQPTTHEEFVNGATIGCSGMVDGDELPFLVKAIDPYSSDILSSSPGVSQTLFWNTSLTPPQGGWGVTPVEIYLYSTGPDGPHNTPIYVRVTITGI